jgi:hypothetical protein
MAQITIPSRRKKANGGFFCRKRNMRTMILLASAASIGTYLLLFMRLSDIQLQQEQEQPKLSKEEERLARTERTKARKKQVMKDYRLLKRVKKENPDRKNRTEIANSTSLDFSKPKCRSDRYFEGGEP